MTLDNHKLNFSEFILLRNLTKDEMDLIIKSIKIHTFKRNETFSTKSASYGGLGFVLSGRLQCIDSLIDGRRVGLYTVEEGDSLGELHLLEPANDAHYFLAMDDVTVAFVSQQSSQSLWFGRIELAREFAHFVAMRTACILNQRRMLSVPGITRRLCIFLQQRPKRQGPIHTVFKKLPTQQQISLMINTTRETVTRLFRILEDQGVLKKKDKMIFLTDPKMLSDIADGVVDIKWTLA